VPQSLEHAFAFFSRPENLQAITPEWLDFEISSTSRLLAAPAGLSNCSFHLGIALSIAHNAP
jgi:ligand-binding SRPBCC domain-containing protein